MNSSRRSAKLSPAQIKKLLIILALVLVVLTALVLVLRNRVKQQFGREEEREVLSASVTTGSISSSVYGSGLLADEDVEQLDIPSGVDVETICVSRRGEGGDSLRPCRRGQPVLPLCFRPGIHFPALKP